MNGLQNREHFEGDKVILFNKYFVYLKTNTYFHILLLQKFEFKD